MIGLSENHLVVKNVSVFVCYVAYYSVCGLVGDFSVARDFVGGVSGVGVESTYYG